MKYTIKELGGELWVVQEGSDIPMPYRDGIKAILEYLEMKPGELAAECGVERKQVYRWRAGEYVPSRQSMMLMRRLLEDFHEKEDRGIRIHMFVANSLPVRLERWEVLEALNEGWDELTGKEK